MTITNPPSASSQIELGKSHYLIRSLWIRRLVWGGLSLWAKICQCTHRCSFAWPHLWVRVYTALELICSYGWKCMEKEAQVASPHRTLPSKANLSYIKVCWAPPLCVRPAGQKLCICVCVHARISQSSSATVLSRWPTVIWRTDFMGPSVAPLSLWPTVPAARHWTRII